MASFYGQQKLFARIVNQISKVVEDEKVWEAIRIVIDNHLCAVETCEFTVVLGEIYCLKHLDKKEKPLCQFQKEVCNKRVSCFGDRYCKSHTPCVFKKKVTRAANPDKPVCQTLVTSRKTLAVTICGRAAVQDLTCKMHSKSKIKCAQLLKNGKPCSRNAVVEGYCKVHSDAGAHSDASVQEKKKCAAMTKRGTSCTRKARVGDYCVMHNRSSSPPAVAPNIQAVLPAPNIQAAVDLPLYEAKEH